MFSRKTRLRFFATLGSVVALAVCGIVRSQPATTQSDVAIDATPPEIRRITFDRFHHNQNTPTTKSGEAALTQSDYEVGAAVTYELTSKSREGDHWHVEARIVKVHVKTSLVDTIYLPQLAPVELRAHEEGHREMNEKIYTEGDPIAHEAAGLLLEGTWPGDGPDLDAAGKAATDAAVHRFCNVYLQHTSKRSSDLGDIYDRLTNHGRNMMLVANAIRLSFAEEKKIAATQPATTQISLR